MAESTFDDNKFVFFFTENINSILNDTIEARRSKVWTSANVRNMIREYTALKNDFRDPKQKQKLVWERLAERLQDQGINVSAEDADKKWRNLKMTFKRIFYEEGRSEQSKSQWEFYDMLLGLFSLEDNNVPVRKSRTISPPRDEGKAYELDMHDDNQIKITTTKLTKVRTTPMKRKVVEEYVEDIGQYQVEELQNVDTESLTVEDHKPQIVQSFDIDFLESRPEFSEPSVVEVHRVKKETTVRRNPLSPTPEMPVFNQSTQPPIWFKNFQKRYDSDTKLILTKLNSIREVQNTQQNCLNILEHKMEMFEETLLRVVGTDQLEESGDEAGPDLPVEEADMEEFYIEETN
jgi:Myb/SANT-like DNA-binding domain